MNHRKAAVCEPLLSRGRQHLRLWPPRLSPNGLGFCKFCIELGISFVTASSRPAMRLAIITVAGLALAGCGRKGPLDLPPGAAQQIAAERAAATNPPPELPPSSASSQAGALFGPQGEEAAPVAPRGRKKAFVLDPLLD